MNISDTELRELLAQRVQEAGGQKAWAKLHGFSGQHVNDLLKSRRLMTSRVAEALGYCTDPKRWRPIPRIGETK